MTDKPEAYSAAAEVGQIRERRSRWQMIKIELKKAPISAWFGFIVIAVYAFVAIFAPVLAPYGEKEVFDLADAPWGGDHFFGTDQIGRDVLSRLIYGARNTIGIALVTTLLSFMIGGGLGLVAAINRSWLDQLISRFVDILMAIPSLIFALVLLSITGANGLHPGWSLIIIIAVLDSTRVFRLTRAVGVSVAVMEYVEAAKLRGEKMGWIMGREILPNIMPPLIAEFGLRFCFVFLTIAALSFLGVGLSPSTANWGSMVQEGASLFNQTMSTLKFAPLPAEILTPGLRALLPAAAIALLTVAVNFVVDWFLHKTSGLKS